MGEVGEQLVKADNALKEKQVKMHDFVRNIANKVKSGGRIASLYTDKVVESAFAPSHLIKKDKGFDVKQALQERKGPFIEVGGPTDTEYWSGMNLIDTQNLDRKVYTSNLGPGLPIYGEDGKIEQYLGRVDFQANAEQLPLLDNSVGALFGSGVTATNREAVFHEAHRVVEPGGLIVWQKATKEDIELAQKQGLLLKECYGQRSPLLGKDLGYNAVFQKPTAPNSI